MGSGGWGRGGTPSRPLGFPQGENRRGCWCPGGVGTVRARCCLGQHFPLPHP